MSHKLINIWLILFCLAALVVNVWQFYEFRENEKMFNSINERIDRQHSDLRFHVKANITLAHPGLNLHYQPFDEMIAKKHSIDMLYTLKIAGIDHKLNNVVHEKPVVGMPEVLNHYWELGLRSKLLDFAHEATMVNCCMLLRSQNIYRTFDQDSIQIGHSANLICDPASFYITINERVIVPNTNPFTVTIPVSNKIEQTTQTILRSLQHKHAFDTMTSTHQFNFP